jgi:AcrR family transcriptional regulator
MTITFIKGPAAAARLRRPVKSSPAAQTEPHPDKQPSEPPQPEAPPSQPEAEQRQKRSAGKRAGLDKDRILAAAVHLLEEADADSVNVRALAGMLGVVPATIRSHFPGGAAAIIRQIAGTALAGAARPYKLQETAEDYLAAVFDRILGRVAGRPVIARIVIRELGRNPLIDPVLAERVLQCVESLGAQDDYLPRGLRRVIGRLCEMILNEAVRPDGAGEERARRISDGIGRLPRDEFPMLTEHAAALATHLLEPVSGPPHPAIAHHYAAAVIALLKGEIEADPEPVKADPAPQASPGAPQAR